MLQPPLYIVYIFVVATTEIAIVTMARLKKFHFKRFRASRIAEFETNKRSVVCHACLFREILITKTVKTRR